MRPPILHPFLGRPFFSTRGRRTPSSRHRRRRTLSRRHRSSYGDRSSASYRRRWSSHNDRTNPPTRHSDQDRAQVQSHQDRAQVQILSAIYDFISYLFNSCRINSNFQPRRRAFNKDSAFFICKSQRLRLFYFFGHLHSVSDFISLIWVEFIWFFNPRRRIFQ